jgi:hypothetical protein
MVAVLDHDRVRLHRARLLLAMRYVLWRIEAIRCVACWREGTSPDVLEAEAGSWLVNLEQLLVELQSGDVVVANDSLICSVVRLPLGEDENL